ncbi:MAG: cobyric acid synthase CobQ, partial [Methanosarcinaceae archaeon]
VLGVLPYFDIRIPSEDSVSIDDKSRIRSGDRTAVEIAIIRFPRISNFTDFEPLENMAHIRYVELGEELGEPDAIILPGTKNTISDLYDLKQSGMDARIKEFHGRIPIIGICGGYQMLGKSIIDSGIENGEAAQFKGLGLLDITTTFDEYEKITVQVTKTVTGSGAIFETIKGESISGYEIHMGATESSTPVFGNDGCVDDSGLVIGTYLHGLFENKNIQRALMSYLYEKKGIGYVPQVAGSESDSYEELADVFRRHVDMKRVCEIIGIDY